MTAFKKIVIIAGPNGAGKTTFAREFLPNEADCPVFVNADLIAAGLAPFSPEVAAVRAGRLMLEEIDNHVRRGESFAFETTLSGLMYARLIPKWRALGYRVKLIYLSLPDSQMAVERENLALRLLLVVAIGRSHLRHLVPELLTLFARRHTRAD